MRNRIIALCLSVTTLLLVFIFSFALITGCDKDNDDETSNEETTEEYIYVPESTTSDGTIDPEDAGDGICFLNRFVKAGVELKCANYKEGVTYNWTITSMLSGDTKTFSNTTGVYTPTEYDIESMITVSVDGYEDLSIYFSNLPVMYFTSDTKYKAINKNNYSSAYLRMQGNSYINKGLYEGACELKVRGNSTASLEKRPFKLRLESKENLLNMGAGISRHWVLLANAIDHTLLRNKLLYDFSGAIGTKYYMHSENVVLIYNGEYYGVYQLCEQVRVEAARVDVFNWEEAAEDAAKAVARKLLAAGNINKDKFDETCAKIEEKLLSDYSWIDSGMFSYASETYSFSDLGVYLPDTTGGYLIEMDFYSKNSPNLATMPTAYQQPLYFSDPEPKTQAGVKSLMKTSLYKNAVKYVQTFEYALHSDDFFFRNSDVHYQATGMLDWGGWGGWGGNLPEADAKDKYGYTYYKVEYKDNKRDGHHYSQLFDFDSLVQNFIFCEFAMNWDSMKNSFFYYKDVDGLAKIGPQWDFDWAWGNINMYNINTNYPTSWHTTIDEFTREQYYQKVQWNRMLIRDPYFLVNAYELYKEIRGTVIEDMIKVGGLIDTYVSNIRMAALANDERWKSTYRAYRGEEFDDAVESMLDFLTTRVEWLDEQFESLDKFIKSLGYYKTSNSLSVSDVIIGDTTTAVTATVKDKKIKTVAFQINGTKIIDVAVTDGIASLTINNSDLITDGSLNCIEIKAKDANGKYIYNEAGSNPGVWNLTLSNYTAFAINSNN